MNLKIVVGEYGLYYLEFNGERINGPYFATVQEARDYIQTTLEPLMDDQDKCGPTLTVEW